MMRSILALRTLAGIASLGVGFTTSVSATALTADPVTVSRSIQALKPGEFLWVPQVAPRGPMMIVVSLQRQLAYVYRNGVIIGVSTVSTGAAGRETPTGIFTVLQKDVDHKSNLYSNAPMPFMQRLTWGGIALHAGKLPGFPASHGCIRLPTAFAKLLYAATARGMTVVITKDAPVPRAAPTPDLLSSAQSGATIGPAFEWQPERSPSGPISIIVSAADHRLIVLRNGKQIGAAPIDLRYAVQKPAAYLLRAVDKQGLHWLSIPLPWDKAAGATNSESSNSKIVIDKGFRARLTTMLTAGTTVIVTPDSLRAASTGTPVIILSDSD